MNETNSTYAQIQTPERTVGKRATSAVPVDTVKEQSEFEELLSRLNVERRDAQQCRVRLERVLDRLRLKVPTEVNSSKTDEGASESPPLLPRFNSIVDSLTEALVAIEAQLTELDKYI